MSTAIFKPIGSLALNARNLASGQRLSIKLVGGSALDRLMAASRMLGYSHSHRNLMTGYTPDYEVVWGRSAIISAGDSSGNSLSQLAITIYDAQKLNKTIRGDEIVLVYGGIIMHKSRTTDDPNAALEAILRTRGYSFERWADSTNE